MRGSLAQAFVQMIVMIFWVRLILRIPRKFIAVNHLAIAHRRDLVIARTEVKADPAAIEISAQGHRRFTRGRHFSGLNDDDFKRLFIDLLHQLDIKAASPATRVCRHQMLRHFARRAHMQTPTAHRPKKELRQTLGMQQSRSLARIAYRRLKHRDMTALALQCQTQGVALARLQGCTRLLAMKQTKRRKSGVKPGNGDVFGSHGIGSLNES